MTNDEAAAGWHRELPLISPILLIFPFGRIRGGTLIAFAQPLLLFAVEQFVRFGEDGGNFLGERRAVQNGADLFRVHVRGIHCRGTSGRRCP